MMVFRIGEWAFGANLEDIYLTVLFWDFELVRDSQNPSNKDFFSVFCTSKYLRVMELRDTKFMVRGRSMGSYRWSNLWFVLAQHVVEPTMTALFQRSAR